MGPKQTRQVIQLFILQIYSQLVQNDYFLKSFIIIKFVTFFLTDTTSDVLLTMARKQENRDSQIFALCANKQLFADLTDFVYVSSKYYKSDLYLYLKMAK